jgi:hypothetical protein
LDNNKERGVTSINKQAVLGAMRKAANAVPALQTTPGVELAAARAEYRAATEALVAAKSKYKNAKGRAAEINEAIRKIEEPRGGH